MSNLDRLMLFGMQNLLLEKDLLRLEKSGINIGHSETVGKSDLVDTELFELDIRVKANKMGDLYKLYFCLENSIRRLILERMSEKHGPTWWDAKVPQQVKDNVKKKQNDEKDSQVTVRSDDPLDYTNFGELIDIFASNWTDFTNLLRSQKAVRQILGQFNQLRNIVAHSCELSDDEITRVKLLINDWLRVQS